MADGIATGGWLVFLAALAVIDARQRVLPNGLVYPGGVAALAAAPWLPAEGYGAALLGGGVIFAALAAVYFWRPGALGAGDVKLAGVIGLALGLRTGLLALLAASVLASGVGVAMIAAGRWSAHTRVPYGPYLGAGAAVMAIAARL